MTSDYHIPLLATCPQCGYAGIYRNRQPGDYSAQCGRWRDGEASAEMDCSMMTGSYPTTVAAAEIWNRRASEEAAELSLTGHMLDGTLNWLTQLTAERDKWKRRAKILQRGYRDADFQVLALTLQKNQLESLGTDATLIRQRDSMHERLVKRIAECAQLRERLEAIESTLSPETDHALFVASLEQESENIRLRGENAQLRAKIEADEKAWAAASEAGEKVRQEFRELQYGEEESE